MGLSFNKFFGNNTDKSQDDSIKDTNQKTTIKGVTPNGNVIVSSKVNWKQEGVQDAGSAKGDVNAFIAGYQSAFARIKKSQELDKDLQESMKKELQKGITDLEADRNKNQNSLTVKKTELENANNDVNDKKDEIAKVKNGGAKINRPVQINFIIGAVILACMTIYLFLFYSSTAYSAFFRDFDQSTSVMTAMFYGNAIPAAFSEGIFEGFFIIFLPIIFMGLGFVVHQFSITSQGWQKYLKTVSLYALTFVFDFLLAYKISKAIYDIEVMTSPTDMPPFSLSIAFQDMDFWIVIFCGFVSYVIWGLVFGFVMNNYEKLVSNKDLLEKLKQDLHDLQQKVIKIQSEITNLANSITDLDAKIKQKRQELNTSVKYDFYSIKVALADYYQGWISYIALCGGDTEQLPKIYNIEKTNVEDWMNGIKNRFKSKPSMNFI